MPQQIPKQEIVIELEKQYDVEEVDLLEPLEVGKFDVLMVVQPSSLPPESLENLIQVIQQGQPTAIFEDPFPYFMRNVPGTGQPKQSPGGMMGMGQRPMPKGDIRRLWAAIGVDSTGSINRQGLFEPDIVWQNYNPYPKLQVGGIPDEWVFVREEAPEADGAISDHDVTRGLDEIFFPFPGMIEPADSDATFTKLLTTGELAGTIAFTDLTENQQDPQLLQALRRRRGRQIVAAEVKGEVELLPAPSADPNAPKPEGKGNVNVIYVADIDLMIPAFLRIRARPDEQEDIQWNFENVTFLLNVIDALSGDTDYVEIRKRQPRHATLRVVEERIQGARDLEFTKGVEFQNKYQEAISLAEKEKDKALERFDEAVNDLRKQQREGKGDPVRLRNELQKLAEKQAAVERNLEIKKQRFQREREAQVKQIRRDVDLQIETIKNGYKFWAVALPWIPPFLVGIVVFVQRRLREREGISKSRLR